MELVEIGEAARRVGMATSALRYYEERGIVTPAARRGGKRMYGPQELHMLAFVQFMRRLGLSLEDTRAVLQDSGTQWRQTVNGTLAALEALIAQAEGARHFLRHALECPAEHPVTGCPFMVETLERALAGVSFEELAAEHGHEVPPPGKALSWPQPVRCSHTSAEGEHGRHA
ncbi:MerR family transcriptional regulator [Streptomyces bathyalis]|uniref:MerR family transcriptional regulator n=1 Tax=Streptomyces bathyalis TaxID=2710756 RepID=A0A7T1TC54_9ACTN|nr:MerR family transcriptional regulator [Streptomyces bathyalis]QPP10278.1 MerR family transcriptional regulator [Streptomyces bathyalis]